MKILLVLLVCLFSGFVQGEEVAPPFRRDQLTTDSAKAVTEGVRKNRLKSIKASGVQNYDIVAVRSIRPDDITLIRFPDVFQSVVHPPSDLVIRKVDGTEEVLVSGNGEDALMDPKLSLDGKWLYFVKTVKVRTVNSQRGGSIQVPFHGSNIYRIELATKRIVRVTDNLWSQPLGGAVKWAADPSTNGATGEASLRYKPVNMGPCPVPGGRLVFTSSRNGFMPVTGGTFPNQQLFICDDIPGVTDGDGEAGRNVEFTGHLNMGGSLHPVLMTTGEIMWSSLESQGTRWGIVWSLWRSYPDGRNWGPLYSFAPTFAYHFHGQRSNGNIFSVLYYLNNNNGFGSLFESPLLVESPEYLSPDERNNPQILPLTIPPSSATEGPHGHIPYGRLSTMRRNQVCVTPWIVAGDFPNGRWENNVFIPMAKVTHPQAVPNNGVLVCITPGPANNKTQYQLPRYHGKVGLLTKDIAVDPTDIEIVWELPGHSLTQPIPLVPWTDIYGTLPPEIPVTPNETATPFAIVGSSSAHIGQWKPVSPSNNFFQQDPPPLQGMWSGIPTDETGQIKNSHPVGMDIVAFEPTLTQSYGPVKEGGWSNHSRERTRLLARIKFDETERPEGDTSWAASIPGDVPFTFRTFGADGRTITFARTWHQMRPGEKRFNCGGCHNHSGTEIKWEDSFAFGKPPKDFRETELVTPEFNRDVLPIFQAKCWECHAPGSGHPVILDKSIASSAYVVKAQSFKSRLSKAIHGEGATVQMPFEREPLSDDEIRTIDTWIDYWCLVSDHPKESGKGAWLDISRPTLFVPRSGPLKIGAFDYFSGLAGTPTATLNGAPVGLTEQPDNVWTANHALEKGDKVIVTAKDNAGNETTIERLVTADPLDPCEEKLRVLREEIEKLKAELEAR